MKRDMVLKQEFVEYIPWAYQNGVRIDFSRPGKPTDNAIIETFNGTLRAECLNAHWFDTLVFSCISKRYMSDCRHEQTSGSHFP